MLVLILLYLTKELRFRNQINDLASRQFILIENNLL